MSEGTKIGAYGDEQEFKSAVQQERVGTPEDLGATKIGELSEFEKDLIPASEPAESAESELSGDAAETAVAQEEPVEASVPAAKPEEFEAEMERLDVDYKEGDIIRGVVRRVEKSGVLVDIFYKSDGFIQNAEFSGEPDINPADTVKPGDEIEVYILRLESKEGYTVLSRKRAEYELAWTEVQQLAKSKDQVSVYISNNVEGGLVVSYKGIKGFIPASQVIKAQDEDLESFVGTRLDVIVLQADRKRRKVIFSNKGTRAKAKKENVAELLEGIEIGQTREGKVTSIKDFGVFVDIGGVEGLVHISEMSWARVTHPSEMVKMGDEVKVFVLGVDRESGKVSLGMKQLEADPWVNVGDTYAVGQIVDGEISRVVPFGAFMRIAANLEGLIHISELSFDHVDDVSAVVKVGQRVTARIVKLLPEEQRIGLSLKGVDGSESVPGDAMQDTAAPDQHEGTESVSDADGSGDQDENTEAAEVASEDVSVGRADAASEEKASELTEASS